MWCTVRPAGIGRAVPAATAGSRPAGRRLKRPVCRAETAAKTPPIHDLGCHHVCTFRPLRWLVATHQRSTGRSPPCCSAWTSAGVAATGDQPAATGSPAPGRQAADRASGYHPAVQQPIPAAAPAPPPRVLIADDAPAMRAALRGLLEDHGLPVIGEAADGLQAVTMAAQLQPDVVVMDVRMPGLDGCRQPPASPPRSWPPGSPPAPPRPCRPHQQATVLGSPAG